MIYNDLRRRLLMMVVACGSCVYWSDDSVAAKSPDGALVLSRIAEDLVGCGGGGHFVIVPTLEDRTRYELEIVSGPRAGTYAVYPECGCPEGTGSLASSDDQWLVQWHCAGATDWVTSAPLDGRYPACYRSDQRPDISRPLSSHYRELSRKGSNRDQLLARIVEAEGQVGVAAALTQTLERRNEDEWAATFETLDAAHKSIVHGAIRLAVSADEVDSAVLARTRYLPPEDRALKISAGMRLVEQAANLYALEHDQAMAIMDELAEERVDDLGPLNCAIKRPCKETCTAIRAATAPCSVQSTAP